MAGQTGVLADLLERGRLVWRLMNDGRVPTWLKVSIPLVVGLYFISPVDLIPDFILGLGQLDDLGVILLGMGLFIRLAPEAVVDEHRRALGHDTNETAGQPTRRISPNDAIDGEYEIVRPKE
jgi:uncharacterized membrane protein YkvA (DUF1232 family)